MALKINTNKVISEDIVNETGEVIGKIEFNPNDERIMKKLSDIVMDLTKKVDEIKSIGEVGEIKDKLETEEDFLETKENFEKIDKLITINYEGIKNAIDGFTEVFGEKTMNAITGGVVSIENLYPLIDFLAPYIKESRQKAVEKYTNGNSTVFE